jgi:hypothetical protein
MAAASWAHISAYCASVAMIAGVLIPRKLLATSVASWVLLAAISGGGTVIAYAASKAAADAVACAAARWAWAAVVVSHVMNGWAAAAADADAGPIHCSPVSSATTDSYPVAAVLNSPASALQAAAAAIIGPAPAPAYMRAELTSGGSAPKSIVLHSFLD